MTSINGGSLNKKISFFDSNLEADGAGGYINKPEVLVLETWASIRQLKATRTAENLQESINATYELKLRQRIGFIPKSNYTIKWDDKSFEITEITEDIDKQKQWVVIAIYRGTGI